MTRKYRIAYIGWTFEDNIGDDLGPIVFEQNLKSSLPEVYENVELVYPRKDWHRTDAAVACIGTLLCPYSYRNGWMRQFALARRRGPLVGVGLGALPAPNWVRWPVSRSYRARLVDWFDALWLRGHDTATELGLGPSHVSGDSVFGYRWAPFSAGSAADRRPILAVNTGRWSVALSGADGRDVVDIVGDACRILEEHFDLLLFSMGRRDDEATGEILRRLSSGSRAIFTRDPFELASELRKCTLGVGTKCHASGLLYSVGVPTINIAYQPKCQDLASVLTDRRFVLPLRNVTANGVVSAVRQLHETTNQSRVQLVTDVQHIREKWQGTFVAAMQPIVDDLAGRYSNRVRLVAMKHAVKAIPAFTVASLRRLRRRLIKQRHQQRAPQSFKKHAKRPPKQSGVLQNQHPPAEPLV